MLPCIMYTMLAIDLGHFMVVIKILFAHFGDNTMLMMSLMREVFMIRSLGVVWDREGEAFT